ncbi:hypothetical protein Goshw_000033 [Gossypium schwendimanii]|uniref:RNase H type-1 domain-containing protein n=1 Tax=Gossypium schwendimanii TaxID=34291 RepID=A0A7J9N0B1_GOSSC|nr:hypothetical protein [Gossypium schwendimanii]
MKERAAEGCCGTRKGLFQLYFQVQLPLIIEFDLNTVSNWLKYRSLCPWSLRKLFAEIEDGSRHTAEIQFAVTNHKKNGMAETLAKASMSRKNFFKAAW